ncbi:hypothetical protein PI20285_10390 [Pediococcus inopinatus]|nr:hypothetical protein PI20285_10390 [Pediococcus inopinatus]KRN62545.1 hypothetical protein IV83_GL002050 [Pediococcus inopinatus]
MVSFRDRVYLSGGAIMNKITKMIITMLASISMAEIGLVSTIGPSINVQASSTYKQVASRKISKTAYHRKSATGTVWNASHKKALHYLKNYSKTTWYVTKRITLKHNGKKTNYYYIKDSKNSKINGYVYTGYLTKGSYKAPGYTITYNHKYGKIQYHRASSKSVSVWNTGHKKAIHNLKNYPTTTWYVDQTITWKSPKGTKGNYYHIVDKNNRKISGYVWHGYVAKGAYTKPKAAVSTYSATSKKTIILPANYYRDLKKVYKSGKDSASIDKKWQTAGEQTYQSSAADKKVIIANVDTMSSKTQLELSKFAAGLVNSVRNQVGMHAVTVTKGSLGFAQDVKKQYTADNWSTYSHDVHAIKKAAADYGLNSGDNYYENASFGYIGNGKSLTMDALKNAIYSSFVAMLFSDGGSAYGHAASITGYMNNNQKAEYFGLSMNSHLSQIHILFVNSQLIKKPSKFSTKAI